jgi:hypothetical protein
MVCDARFGSHRILSASVVAEDSKKHLEWQGPSSPCAATGCEVRERTHQSVEAHCDHVDGVSGMRRREERGRRTGMRIEWVMSMGRWFGRRRGPDAATARLNPQSTRRWRCRSPRMGCTRRTAPGGSCRTLPQCANSILLCIARICHSDASSKSGNRWCDRTRRKPWRE